LLHKTIQPACDMCAVPTCEVDHVLPGTLTEIFKEDHKSALSALSFLYTTGLRKYF